MSRRTEKKVIAKLKLRSALDGVFTLLIFAHASGTITYHFMSELSMNNQSIGNLQIKKPLPCVEMDYDNTTAIVKAVTTAIQSGTYTVIGRKTYEG